LHHQARGQLWEDYKPFHMLISALTYRNVVSFNSSCIYHGH
jgi:hypothetical protein